MRKARILVVEDEAIIAMEMENSLRNLGYEVTAVVNTADDALEKAEEDKPDLILMDIRIQGDKDGIETAEIIKNRFGIPVVFSTAYLDEERIERAKITMPFGYVLKPIQERDLKVTLEMALYVAKIDKERRNTELRLKESERQVRSTLEKLLSPGGSFEGISLDDIMDASEIQAMMNDFHKLTGIGIAVLDLEGNVLVKTGWQDICTKFHRIHPETSKNCLESDTRLSKGVAAGTFKMYKCKNNMWDIVTPIFIGDNHIGNIFLGQFFFEDEETDIDVFYKQAQKYGFNWDDYRSALDSVPRWSRETVTSAMNFYSKFAGRIAKLGYSNIKLARLLNQEKAVNGR